MSDEITTEEVTETSEEFAKSTNWEVGGTDGTTAPGSPAGIGSRPIDSGGPQEHRTVWEGHSSGVHASGGVGGVNSGDAQNFGNLGQADMLFQGVNTTPVSVDPSGQRGGGILNPEQARQFIDYVWDATVLAQDGRRVTMRANTMELEKVNVGERVIRAAAQADGTYENTGAVFSKVDLTTKKLRLDWEVSTEALEDNIEGAALEDHLVRLMTSAFANDIEDLAINGDRGAQVAGDVTAQDVAFLQIMDGFIVQAKEGGHAAVPPVFGATADPGFGDPNMAQPGPWDTDETGAAGTWKRFINEGGGAHLADGSPVTKYDSAALQELVLAMPRKYRALKNGLRMYAGTDTFAAIVAEFGVNDNVAWDWPHTSAYLTATGNKPQTVGGPRRSRVLGFDVLEVPYFPSDYVEMTFPQNRIWGFQRDITVNRDYIAKKDTIEYTVFVRFGIAWEELDAVAYLEGTSA
jgi:hypothetical protein